MNIRIANIGQLVTPVLARATSTDACLLEVRAGAELLIRDGRIAAVGTGKRPEHLDEEIDAGGGVLLPALVDPHTHFDTSIGLADAKARLIARLRRALTGGVTTVEVKCSSLEGLSALSAVAHSGGPRLPSIVPTLYCPARSPETAHAASMSDLIGDAIPTVRRNRWARFCDVECGGGAYTLEEARTILRAARAAGLHLSLHAGGSGLSTLGAVAIELGITAIGHAGELGIVDPDEWNRAALVPVLLPGERLLRDRPAPDVARLLDAGLPAGLGTNSGAGPVAVGSMWFVVALAVGTMGLSLDQALVAVTLHNARALESGTEIGAIEAGRRADLMILDVPDYRELCGSLGDNPVRTVVLGGEVVHQR
jgi:imidazolonepropionase